MAAVNRKHFTEQARHLLLMLGLALALKQFYSTANAQQLQWMLFPLVLSLECFSDLSFEPTADSEWLDRGHRITIVKACAGINFLIISLTAYLWQQRTQAIKLRSVSRALLSAWITSLCANTLRILLCVYCQDLLRSWTGLSPEESHRFIGIAVYFLGLWTQLAGFKPDNFGRMAPIAILLYLSMTVAVPLIRAELLGLDRPNTQHLLWVVAFPATVVALHRIFGSRERKHSIS